jgi:hypothetical protein
MWSGECVVRDFDATEPAKALGAIGELFERLSSSEAIGLGVPKDGRTEAKITTKDRLELGLSDPDAIPRAKTHFGWPDGPSLVLFDGDDIDGPLYELVVALYPPARSVAMMSRPGPSASVLDPRTNKPYKCSEHGYVLLDDPTQTKACLDALMRLAWCCGTGPTAGRLKISACGSALIRGPVDVSVGSRERLAYEGAVILEPGLTALPRKATVIGGTEVLCATDLLAYADQHAPVAQFEALKLEAKNDPAFIAKQDETRAQWLAKRKEMMLARGEPLEKVEKECNRIAGNLADAAARARGGGSGSGGQHVWIEMTKHWPLFRPNGEPFTPDDVDKNPKAYHLTECADPVEGLNYQTKNCGWIVIDGTKIKIYSQAHGGSFGYYYETFDREDFAAKLLVAAKLNENKISFFGPPIVKLGPLSEMADRAAKILVKAEVPFYQRGDKMVRPVVQPVQSFDGKMTSAAQLVEIELPYLRDMLCRKSRRVKFEMRSKKWRDTHPPVDAAMVLLKRFGEWPFPQIAGIISTPTLRRDGTILSQPGYDPATQLLLIDPPPMPDIAEQPSKDDAMAALALLKDLLAEFPFADVDDNDNKGVSRAVALSAIISTVCRGAFPVVPMHTTTAPVSSSGKSYLLSIVSLIATGQLMPVLSAGGDEKELEKRIGAAVINGQSLICVDNVEGEISGDALRQLIEQPRPSVRVLGLSKLVPVNSRSLCTFANGINMGVAYQLNRRVLRARLDPSMESPDQREFKGRPDDMIRADRGKYIAACLTICRAYAAAGWPKPKQDLKPLASFEGWSDAVRSPLVWLDEADPVKSIDTARGGDAETTTLREMLSEWKAHFGAGQDHMVTARQVIDRCDENRQLYMSKDYIFPKLRSAVLGVMPPQHRLRPDVAALGKWLGRQTDRLVGGMRFRKEAATGWHSVLWWLEEV